MVPSDPYDFALAALTTLGTDLIATRMRGRTASAQIGAELHIELPPAPIMNNSNSRGSSSSTSRSAHSARTSLSVSSRSSSKSLTKSRSRGKKTSKSDLKPKSKAKTASSSKTKSKSNSLGTATAGTGYRNAMSVAKAEKYVPPKKGTFRTSYTRFLRAEVLCGKAGLVLEVATDPQPLQAIADKSNAGESLPKGNDLSIVQPRPQGVTRQSSLASLGTKTIKLAPEDIPTLALSEFDMFSASIARQSTDRNMSEIWTRSPLAPPPPSVRRWLKQARTAPVGRLEEMADQMADQMGLQEEGG